MRKTARLTFGLALAAALTLGVAGTALADAPANPHCWGVVVSQRATIYQDMGEHSSSFAGEPRLGLGNFARMLHDLGLTAGPHISDAGSVAAALDGLSGTHCP